MGNKITRRTIEIWHPVFDSYPDRAKEFCNIIHDSFGATATAAQQHGHFALADIYRNFTAQIVESTDDAPDAAPEKV